jgi:hypothetical protein
LNSDDLLTPLAVDPTLVLERFDVSELLFDGAFIYLSQPDRQRLQHAAQRRRQQIPGRAECASNLNTYVDVTVRKCPLCGHEKGGYPSDEKEESSHLNHGS